MTPSEQPVNWRDLADHMSAVEQNARTALYGGDQDTYYMLQKELQQISNEAQTNGATTQSHPGFFSWFGHRE